jgi:hypothetical protein
LSTKLISYLISCCRLFDEASSRNAETLSREKQEQMFDAVYEQLQRAINVEVKLIIALHPLSFFASFSALRCIISVESIF